MTRCLMAAMLVLMLAGEARSGSWVDGNQLHKWCSADNGTLLAGCSVYVSGITDVMVDAPVLGWSACFPDHMTIGQLGDVVERWLEQHPELRHYGASELVAEALSTAFPCE